MFTTRDLQMYEFSANSNWSWGPTSRLAGGQISAALEEIAMVLGLGILQNYPGHYPRAPRVGEAALAASRQISSLLIKLSPSREEAGGVLG